MLNAKSFAGLWGLTTLLLGCAADRSSIAAESGAAQRHQAPATAPAVRSAVAQIEAVLRGDQLEVSFSLPLDELPLSGASVRAELYEDLPFAEGPPGFERFVRVVDAEGIEHAWTGALPVVRGALVLRYRVSLTHHLASPLRGIDEVPHPTRGGFVLAGRAFIPRTLRLDDGRRLEVPCRLRLELPEGGSLTSNARRDGAFYEAESCAALADNFWVTGQFHRRDLAQDATTLQLVSSDFEAEQLQAVGDLVQRTLKLSHASLGALGPHEKLVLFDQNPLGIDGCVIGDTISVLSERPPSGRAMDDSGVVLVHELAHLWNRSDVWWLHEGLTRYLEVWFKTQLDGVSSQELAEQMGAVWDRYLDEAEGRTIATATESWGYAAGAMWALCLDGDLRERGSSVFEVHRRARAATAQTREVSVTGEAFLTALRALSAESAARAEAMLHAEGPVDFAPCFRRLGYEPTLSSYHGLRPEVIEQRVLRVQSRSRYRAEVYRAAEGSALRAGDVIEAIDAQPVRSFEDIAYRLRDTRAGAKVRLSVRRDGALVLLRLVMPGVTAADKKPRRHIEMRAHAATAG